MSHSLPPTYQPSLLFSRYHHKPAAPDNMSDSVCMDQVPRHAPSLAPPSVMALWFDQVECL